MQILGVPPPCSRSDMHFGASSGGTLFHAAVYMRAEFIAFMHRHQASAEHPGVIPSVQRRHASDNGNNGKFHTVPSLMKTYVPISRHPIFKHDSGMTLNLMRSLHARVLRQHIPLEETPCCTMAHVHDAGNCHGQVKSDSFQPIPCYD
ncbi:hypothetical protein M514_18822 [Trichuris suis]|uniref:Uncharacterized protein n=1 Tax=Trichuris suis TaxID=68888 RepID=A0A085NHS3_9BILA|nr:hypothetical protein M514_18822 [Trichuris suis]